MTCKRILAHNAAHCRRHNDRSIAVAISSPGRRSSSFLHFKVANQHVDWICALASSKGSNSIHSSLQHLKKKICDAKWSIHNVYRDQRWNLMMSRFSEAKVANRPALSGGAEKSAAIACQTRHQQLTVSCASRISRADLWQSLYIFVRTHNTTGAIVIFSFFERKEFVTIMSRQIARRSIVLHNYRDWTAVSAFILQRRMFISRF